MSKYMAGYSDHKGTGFHHRSATAPECEVHVTKDEKAYGARNRVVVEITPRKVGVSPQVNYAHVGGGAMCTAPRHKVGCFTLDAFLALYSVVIVAGRSGAGNPAWVATLEAATVDGLTVDAVVPAIIADDDAEAITASDPNEHVFDSDAHDAAILAERAILTETDAETDARLAKQEARDKRNKAKRDKRAAAKHWSELS